MKEIQVFVWLTTEFFTGVTYSFNDNGFLKNRGARETGDSFFGLQPSPKSPLGE